MRKLLINASNLHDSHCDGHSHTYLYTHAHLDLHTYKDTYPYSHLDPYVHTDAIVQRYSDADACSNQKTADSNTLTSTDGNPYTVRCVDKSRASAI